MNIFTIIALLLGGGTYTVDRLFHKLPHWLAIGLYTAAFTLHIIGMMLWLKAGKKI